MFFICVLDVWATELLNIPRAHRLMSPAFPAANRAVDSNLLFSFFREFIRAVHARDSKQSDALSFLAMTEGENRKFVLMLSSKLSTYRRCLDVAVAGCRW